MEKSADTENGAAEKSAESQDSEASDGVEIPKQQSAEEAADNEADEGARQ
ncbi:gliding motility protein [Streptomyces vastus]